MQYKWYDLTRTGKRKFKDYGIELFNRSSKIGDPDFWYRVKIYQSINEKTKQVQGYVVGISRKTCLEMTEHDEFDVVKARTRLEVHNLILKIVPELANAVGIALDLVPGLTEVETTNEPETERKNVQRTSTESKT